MKRWNQQSEGTKPTKWRRHEETKRSEEDAKSKTKWRRREEAKQSVRRHEEAKWSEEAKTQVNHEGYEVQGMK